MSAARYYYFSVISPKTRNSSRINRWCAKSRMRGDPTPEVISMEFGNNVITATNYWDDGREAGAWHEGGG